MTAKRWGDAWSVGFKVRSLLSGDCDGGPQGRSGSVTLQDMQDPEVMTEKYALPQIATERFGRYGMVGSQENHV